MNPRKPKTLRQALSDGLFFVGVFNAVMGVMSAIAGQEEKGLAFLMIAVIDIFGSILFGEKNVPKN